MTNKEGSPYGRSDRDRQLGRFMGQGGRRAFADLSEHPPVPVIEVAHSLPADGIIILGKNFSVAAPLGHTKGAVGERIVRRSRETGEWDDVDILDEETSGNTGSGLGFIASLYKRLSVRAYVSKAAVREEPLKMKLMQFYGVQIVATDKPDERAKEEGKKPRHRNPDQYSNPYNIELHEEVTGRQLDEQTKDLGGLTIFSAALGSTATGIGTLLHFDEKYPMHPAIPAQKDPVSIPAEPARSRVFGVGSSVKVGEVVSGARTDERLKKIAFAHWEDRYVEPHGSRQRISAKEARKAAIALSRDGFPTGKTGGLAYVGLMKELESRIKAKTIDKLRNAKGLVVAAFIAPDGPSSSVSDPAFEEEYLPIIYE